jgi:hypothetical protein
MRGTTGPAVERRTRWERSGLIRGDCTICTGTCGSGVRIGTGSTNWGRPRIRRGRRRATAGCFAVGAGSIRRRTAGPPPGTGSTRRAGAGSLGSGWSWPPGRGKGRGTRDEGRDEGQGSGARQGGSSRSRGTRRRLSRPASRSGLARELMARREGDQCIHGLLSRRAAVSAASRVPGISRLQFHDRLRSRPSRALLHSVVDPPDPESGRDARAPTSLGCAGRRRALTFAVAARGGGGRVSPIQPMNRIDTAYSRREGTGAEVASAALRSRSSGDRAVFRGTLGLASVAIREGAP